jgi:hypothetical protein
MILKKMDELITKIIVWFYDRQKVFCVCNWAGVWKDCDIKFKTIDGHKFVLYYCPECERYQTLL